METRISSRVSLNLKIISKIDESAGQSIALAKGNNFEADTIDINASGISFVIKKYFLPKGLNIDLLIDGASFGLKKVMKIKGEVRYCRNIKVNTYKCGIKFLEMPREYKDAINKFVESMGNIDER